MSEFENNDMNEFEFDEETLEEMFSGMDAVINLVLDDDTEMTCVVVAIFPVPSFADYDGEYAALLPIDEDTEDEEESEVLLYRYAEDEDGTMLLDNIETDEEYDAVAEVYMEIIEELMEEEE